MKTSNSPKRIKIAVVVVGLMAAIVLNSATSARAATWTQKADMPTARHTLSTSVVNGKIYAIGGGIHDGAGIATSVGIAGGISAPAGADRM